MNDPYLEPSTLIEPDEDVKNLEQIWAVQEIMKLRQAIRYHRDQKGDDRCWLDDAKLYEVLPEHIPVDHTLPPEKEFLGSCKRFYECRQGKTFTHMDECYDMGEYRSLNTPKQN